jgi:hypothetical protein
MYWTVAGHSFMSERRTVFPTQTGINLTWLAEQPAHYTVTIFVNSPLMEGNSIAIRSTIVSGNGEC